MMDTQACETPMSDHIARFWRHLTEEHVRILLDLRRNTSSVIYWDGASFSNDVAKALVKERDNTWTAVDDCKALLEAINHTLYAHGKVDVNTPLHDRLQRTLDMLSDDGPKQAKECL